MLRQIRAMVFALLDQSHCWADWAPASSVDLALDSRCVRLVWLTQVALPYPIVERPRKQDKDINALEVWRITLP